uniref:RNA-directed RNA polymerase L n=1 Tax=Nova virus TaxID=660955 RepID=A0A1B1LUI7_9VIRU|nr:RNA-dependent RNA polymerase [Nova virus]
MKRYLDLEREIRQMPLSSLSATECIGLLDQLYAVRHDLVDEMIKHDWSDNKDKETPIVTVLMQAGISDNSLGLIEKVVIPDHPTGKNLGAFMRTTPDNYKIEGTKITFIEVTVTSDVDKGLKEKYQKYGSGMNTLQKELDKLWRRGELARQYTIIFNVVSVKNDGSNLSTQWPSRRNQGVVQHMRLLQALIQQVREKLIKNEEKSILEAMFNLKFNIGTQFVETFNIPVFQGMQYEQIDCDALLTYVKNWLSKDRKFAFNEVSGQAVKASFKTYEDLQVASYKQSKKPRNFLLLQVAVQSDYKPATIVSDQLDTRYLTRVLHLEGADTPVQHLAKDMMMEFIQLEQVDIVSFYGNKQSFERTHRVPEPGTFKINMSKLHPDSRSFLETLTRDKEKVKRVTGVYTPEEIESISVKQNSEYNSCIAVIESIQTSLTTQLGNFETEQKINPARTSIDRVLLKFMKNEITKYMVDVLRKTVCWHVGHLTRDITEALIAHSGLKRSKYWSFHAFNNGNVGLFILPSKSLEVSGSYIRYFTVFKDGFGIVDHDNIDSIKMVDGVRWIYSKVMSIDLNRLMALNIAFEKALVATAVWFQYYVEDQAHFPLITMVRNIFSIHYLLAITQKMKLCALFDNIRYLIPACTSQYSGYDSLIEKFVNRPFKSAIEIYIYDRAKKLLVSLAQNNKFRYYSKVKLLGLCVDQSTVGASGIYPSLFGCAIFKHYRSVISEATTCFFLFEKGLHGTMTEEAKIHLETVEWANKIKEKEAKYGKEKVENGYSLYEVMAGEVQVEQQLYCKDVVILAANELNKVLIPKSQSVLSSIVNKHWDKPYFSQVRNISLKGMSGQLQEDGHLAASVTLIEAIRYLSNHSKNPSLMELYNETRHVRAQARIVRKHQRTEADRGFFIVTMPTRVRLEIIEDYYDALAKNVNEEYISYGGEKKILQIQISLERALRWASGTSQLVLSNDKRILFKRKLMYVSADATKWSPGDNSAKFRLFTAAVSNGMKDDLLKNCVIDALRNIYETEFFLSRRLRGYLDNMETKSEAVKEFLNFFDFQKERSGLVRGNWLQGNLNKCSSLFAVGISFLFKKIWSMLFPELDYFIEVAHHSDDALFIYGYLEPVDDGSDWFMYVSHKIQAGFYYWHAVDHDMWKTMFNLHEHLLLMGSIKVSPKKTTVSPTNAEFLSTFFEGCAVSIPFTKILLGALSDLPGLGFFDDLAAAQSRCVKALDMGANPQVAQLVVGLVNNKVERLYGTAPGMVNNPARYLSLSPEDIPICLGGTGPGSIMELATAGIAMADKCSLRKALQTYQHKASKSSSYHLGLFKFLMLLSEDVFNHDTLGEFCFTGKVQWKIFTPKSEFEFHDLYSPTIVKNWTDEHPSYDYVVPTRRDDLLIYLVRRLNEPSIMAAMTLQSPIQLRFRMQAKQHLNVCRYKSEWVSFRQLLAAADVFAQEYSPNQNDLDLFQTLCNCTFSKEFAWRDFLNTVDCEVLPQKRIHRPKVARTFTVKERDQAIQNPISVVIAYRFAKKPEEIRDVLKNAKFPDSISNDLDVLHKGVHRELGLDISDVAVMKRVAPMLYKSSRSRIVLVNGNVEGTAESICSYWLKDISMMKTIKVRPHREVLKAVSIFGHKDTSGDKKDLAALRVCIEVWRWAKHNDADVREWFHSLWFEDRTFMDWVNKFQTKGLPIVDPEVQCAGLMIADLTRDESILQMQANRRAYSGKQYDAYCIQTYNEEKKQYEGDLRVTFNFGTDCARLEIFWDKQDYLLETSITSRHVLKIMMEEVSKELQGCGMRFKTEQRSHTSAVVLFKTDAGFEWGKPNVPCVVFTKCVLRTSLRTHTAIKHDFMIKIVDNGFRAIAQYDLDSPRFMLAHCYHILKDVRYQAIDTVGAIYYGRRNKLYLNPIISAGLFENFMKGIPAVIPPTAYSLIMNKAKISVDLFMFNKLLALINPNNILNLEGLHPAESGYSTVTSISSTLWSEEMELEEAEVEDDEYVIDLDELDFQDISYQEDIEHYLQEETMYGSDLIIQSESLEVSRVRGIVKLNEPIRLIKSWVSKGLLIEKVFDPIAIILITRYFSKKYRFGGQQVSTMDPYDLTEFEAVVRGWGELVFDQFEEADKQAREYAIKYNPSPEELIPDSVFSFRHTELLLNRLFFKDKLTSFY